MTAYFTTHLRHLNSNDLLFPVAKVFGLVLMEFLDSDQPDRLQEFLALQKGLTIKVPRRLLPKKRTRHAAARYH